MYWLAQSANAVPRDQHWMSSAEIAALERLRIPKRRADWRLGRWTAKLAIAAHQHLSPVPEVLAMIELRAATSGAPQAFVEGRPAPFPISLSHSEGMGFCAIAGAGRDIGCDVERVTPHSRAFVDDYFTAEEREMVRRTPAMLHDLLVTLLWSAKESALKALQCGLRADTRSVTAKPAGVALRQGVAWRPLTVRNTGGRVFHGWWREDGDFVWTLLASRPVPGDEVRFDA